ncbi:hypothetical protein HGRIS_009062 [Hohenbuehelia grisea]|uniref:Uncharacterized protein n=1 Tax=Hohenbuehelia grisea TaxID=104357 RepID=A0ABR3J054_9AGAR
MSFVQKMKFQSSTQKPSYPSTGHYSHPLNGLLPTSSQSTLQTMSSSQSQFSKKSTTSSNGPAQMLDDDNMSWGPPKRSKRS